ncbi:MAG TPA: amino acid adenylation domain-containing protein, partial [Thermoanaerobaculia bacterium]|nr:amino acid adenylation domain-containing protein [Thermoanaerobaculia bacterium]
TLVLRGDLSARSIEASGASGASGEPGFGELLARTREVTLGAYAHQDLPFEKLVEALQPERSRAHAPLFQVLLVLQSAGTPLELPGLTLARLDAEVDRTHFDLTLNLHETGGGVRGTLAYATDLFDAPTAGRLAAHLAALLAAAVADPETSFHELPMLAPAELGQLLAEAAADGSGGALSADSGAGTCVHQRVAARAARSPFALAVAGGDAGEELSYGELERRARTLAGRLQRLGVGPETVVGLLLERSPELIVAALAVLHAGGAFLPLDPAQPAERLAWSLADAGCPVLVTRGELAALLPTLPTAAARLVLLDRPAEEEPVPAALVPAAVGPDHLAYVIYTSGSTGRPKGIAVRHGALANLVDWHQGAYGVDAAARASVLAGVGFDASVWEVWPSLAAGASLWLPPRETVQDPARLVAWLAEHAITHAFLPTPLAERALGEPLPAGFRLRFLLTGGDRLRLGAPAAAPFALVNHYGPTEATVVATAGLVQPMERLAPGLPALPAIGTAIAGTAAYVLDRLLRPVPPGAPGELCLAGAGLARGYLGRPDLTAAAFVPNAFGGFVGGTVGGLGDRLYRTGDLVRRPPGGELEFLGRIDQQVKVRGFRIELGEIDSVLAGHPGVAAAVVALSTDTRGEGRLVAYVVTPATTLATDAELRGYLADRLPSYMVPAAIVRLDGLPLTPNGKIDRRALPAPVFDRDGEAEAFEAPSTELELALAEIWSEVLGVTRLGIHDSFFDLGGHSLQVTQMLGRVRLLFEVDVPLRVFFERPTLEGLSLAIAEGLMGGLGEEQLSEIFGEVAEAAPAETPPLSVAGHKA